jgi:hypothetical protein
MPSNPAHRFFVLREKGEPGSAVAYLRSVDYPHLHDAQFQSNWSPPAFDVGTFEPGIGRTPRAGVLTDFVNNDADWLIVHARVRAAIERALGAAETVQWLDVHLVVGQDILEKEYVVANILVLKTDALHPTKATYRGPVLTKVVLRHSSVRDNMLFRIVERPQLVYVRGDLRECLDGLEPSDVWWEEVEAAE